MAAKTKCVENVLHHRLILYAETIARLHIEESDGRRRFNRSAFLHALECGIREWRLHVGGLSLDATAIARYLWCCLRRPCGEDGGSDTFRGMAILD